MKKLLTGILILCAVWLFCGCGGSGGNSDTSPADAYAGDATRLSFRDCMDPDILQSLDGQTVTASGYLSALYPDSGSFAYLMSLPGQSAPFCKPNSDCLVNTIPVIAAEGRPITFTDSAVRITGTLELSESGDDFEYTSNFRIVNAVAAEIEPDTSDGRYDLMLAVAEDGVAEEMNSMLNYLHFICQWSHYRSYYADEDGKSVLVSLYPGDVEAILADKGEYGYADMCSGTYFDDLIEWLDSISSTGLEDLKSIVRSAKELETEALKDLSKRACTYDKETDSYIQTRDGLLYDYWSGLFLRFSSWLSAWEAEPLPVMSVHS